MISDIRLFFLVAGPGVVLLPLGLIVALLLVTPAHADTVAEQIFGHWQTITVANIAKPVPEFEYFGSALGAVGRVVKNTEVIGCPVRESGKVVGWSMSCKDIRQVSDRGK